MLLLSPHSVRSRWVKRELMFALNHSHFQGRVVPVRIRACDSSLLSWTLDELQTVDLRSRRREAFAELLKVWGLTYRPPA